MKKLFVFAFAFACLGFISCYGCKQGAETTNHKDTTSLSDEAISATTNNSNDIVIAGSDGLRSISVFSKCTNYDNKLSTVASEVRFIP